MPEFRLPDLGEGLADAELVAWRVAVGDTVALNDVIAEVETAKAVVELPSPFAGTVAALLAEPGQTVLVGEPLIRIGDGDEPEPEPQRQAVLVGYGPDHSAPTRRRAKPAARKLARELGVDLTTIPGDDVVTVSTVAAATNPTTAQETRVPASGVRKRTAEAMTRSANTIPAVTEFVTCDVTESVELLDTLRGTPAFADLKLTPLALVARIALAALADHPTINTSWDDSSGEIVTKHHVNLGIAVAAPRGLLVPNIKDAQHLSLRDLCRAITHLADLARHGNPTPTDMTNGTFTITNVGVFGIDTGTPMINPGEAAILCLGAISQRPWVVDNRVEPRWVTTLSLSFDHRLIDGEQGSRFLADIATTLTHPATLIGR